MKLEIELVPKTSWWNNLRKILPKSEWDKIRKKHIRTITTAVESAGTLHV